MNRQAAIRRILKLPTGLLLALVMQASLHGQAADLWDFSSTHVNFRNGVGSPQARGGHVAIMAGQYLFVFGGMTSFADLNSGGIYDTVNDQWLSRPNLTLGVGAPSIRRLPTGAHQGGKVFVFGGTTPPLGQNDRNDGGIYDIATDTWELRPGLASNANGPGVRFDAFAASSGGRFLVFGGSKFNPVNSYRMPVLNGGVYDPVLDSWVSIASLNTLIGAPEFNQGAVWMDDGFYARGGFGGSVVAYPGSSGFVCAAGGVFSADAMDWLPRPQLRSGTIAPDRWNRGVVWTGELCLEYGGRAEYGNPPTVYISAGGLAYSPASDSFVSLPALNSGNGGPGPREVHRSVWTGAHFMIIGGANEFSTPMLSGALYDPVLDTWVSNSVLHNPSAGPLQNSTFSVSFDGSSVFFCIGGPQSDLTGGVYVPPRVAPTIRSAAPTGVTQTTWPMGGVPPGGQSVQVGQFWRHRITVYGCPRSTVTVTGMPPWMSKRDLDTGCFLEGTPALADDNILSIITVIADNGIGTAATQTFNVAVGNGSITGGFTSLPVVAAEAGEMYAYTPLYGGQPAPTVVPLTLPTWLAWNGVSLTGVPPLSLSGSGSPVELRLMVGTSVVAAQPFVVGVTFNDKDITRDKAIDVVDVQRVVNLILALGVEAYPGEGDANGDTVVDVVDVQAVVNKILAP